MAVTSFQLTTKLASAQTKKLCLGFGCKIRPLSQVPMRYLPICLTASTWDFPGFDAKRAHCCTPMQCLAVRIFLELLIFQQQICSPNAHWKALHSDHAVANGWMLLECSCALCSLKSWGLWGCWQSIEAEIRRCPRSVASRLWAPSSRQYLPLLSIWIDFTIPAGICLFPGYVGLTKWHHPHRPWR